MNSRFLQMENERVDSRSSSDDDDEPADQIKAHWRTTDINLFQNTCQLEISSSPSSSGFMCHVLKPPEVVCEEGNCADEFFEDPFATLETFPESGKKLFYDVLAVTSESTQPPTNKSVVSFSSEVEEETQALEAAQLLSPKSAKRWSKSVSLSDSVRSCNDRSNASSSSSGCCADKDCREQADITRTDNDLRIGASGFASSDVSEIDECHTYSAPTVKRSNFKPVAVNTADSDDDDIDKVTVGSSVPTSTQGCGTKSTHEEVSNAFPQRDSSVKYLAPLPAGTTSSSSSSAGSGRYLAPPYYVAGVFSGPTEVTTSTPKKSILQNTCATITADVSGPSATPTSTKQSTGQNRAKEAHDAVPMFQPVFVSSIDSDSEEGEESVIAMATANLLAIKNVHQFPSNICETVPSSGVTAKSASPGGMYIYRYSTLKEQMSPDHVAFAVPPCRLMTR